MTSPTRQQLHQGLDHAIKLHQSGQVAEAERIYRQILQHDPNQPDALHLLGLIAHHAGVREPAVELMSRAIAIAPNMALYRINLAKVYRALGRWGEATGSARRGVELAPNVVEGLVELSACLRGEGKLEEAETVARRAVERKPDHPQALNAHANALADLDRFDEAIVEYEKVLRIQPGWPEALSNYGEALRKLGRLEEAEKCFRQAAAQTSDVGDPHFNLALVLLARGEFIEGWREYEWRWQRIGVTPPRATKPLWDGSNLAGRTILLHSEQGFGDSIQFVRYAAMLREEFGAGRVIVACEPPLMSLLATVPGVNEVVDRSIETMPPFDVHCPLASLPHRVGTTLETIPARVPYVAFNPPLAARWRAELKLSRDVYNVGLVWAGSAIHKNDRHRSCRLADFAPLGAVEKVRFLSLQLGPAREQLKDAAHVTPALNIIDAATDIHDFADSAALLSELDLLISVDTAPAHLAGALARPVWTIHPFVADFRWLLNRADSPWYPTMRLFRQPRAGDWAAVMSEVQGALRTAARR